MRYDVEAIMLPPYNDDAPVFFNVSCGNVAGEFPGGSVKNDRSDSFVCFHMDPSEEVNIEAYGVDSNTLFEKTLKANVKASTGKAFQGEWRFGALGVYEVATIDAGGPTIETTTDPDISNPGGEFYGVQYDFGENGFPPGIYAQA